MKPFIIKVEKILFVRKLLDKSKFCKKGLFIISGGKIFSAKESFRYIDFNERWIKEYFKLKFGIFLFIESVSFGNNLGKILHNCSSKIKLLISILGKIVIT